MSNPALALPDGATWRYDSRSHAGRCLIANDTLTVAMSLEKFLFEAPDVCEIEAWLRGIMGAAPTTVELIAVAAHARWKMSVTVRGYSDSHGNITVKIPADLGVIE